MDLRLKDQLFVVGGATSGLGYGVVHHLVNEGAQILAIARSADKLDKLKAAHPYQISTLSCDLTRRGSVVEVLEAIGDRKVTGMVLNAGGPPAGAAMEMTIEQWDGAYDSVVRWKIALTKAIVTDMMASGYGRLLYIESRSVKEPIGNLVLSNAMRAAVTGYVKTMSQEIAHTGVTMNVLAPGYHDTAAALRVVKKNAQANKKSVKQVREELLQNLPTRSMGDPIDFGSLAAWLLSPHSSYITGQTISVDGGSIGGIFG